MLATTEGVTFLTEDHYDEAEKALREALEKQGFASGQAHPSYGRALINLGAVLAEQEQHAEALEMHQRALKVFEETMGDHHPLYIVALQDSADDLRYLGRLDEARASAERALALAEEALGPEHSYAAAAARALGLVALEQRQYAEAVRHLSRAVASVERLLGPAHSDVGYVQTDLARALAGLGRHTEALALYKHALALYAANGSDGAPRMSARARSRLGASLLATRQPAEALAAFEAALAWQEAHDPSKRELCTTRLGVAQALWATRGDRDRAQRLAAQAVEACEGAGPIAQDDLAAARAWLEAPLCSSHPDARHEAFRLPPEGKGTPLCK
jgi:tetratricopeptide (TPR) repeat protein